MSNIILVPTSHIARESLQKIEHVIKKEKPDLVAVELDLNRFYAMRKGHASNTDIIKNLGFLTFVIFWILKKLQEWLGKKVNILPGSEMLHAVKIGEKQGLKIAFIDQDIRITFLRIKEIKNMEKLKLIWFVIKGLTVGILLSKIKKGEKIDLSKVPEKGLVEQAMTLLKREFPGFYRILVTERNIYMANKLKQLSLDFKKIVVVIGAGHVEGMQKLLSKK